MENNKKIESSNLIENRPFPLKLFSKKSNSVNTQICCEELLKAYSLKVELRPGRYFNVCYIPGNQSLNSTHVKCFNEECAFNRQNDPTIRQLRDFYKQSPQTKNTAFLLHGVGGETKVWLHQIVLLNYLGLNIVTMDFIGHGRSDAPAHEEAYHFSEISEDVLQLFDRYKTQYNVIIGHSYGCSFSSIVAKQREDFVNGLIMISGGGPIPLAPEMGVFSLPKFFLKLLEKPVKKEFFRRAFHSGSRQDPCYMTAINAPTHVLKNILKGQEWEEGGEDFYSKIKCPVLLIHGRKDKLIPFDDVSLMEKTLRRSTLHCIDNAGHMAMMESPLLCNKVIIQFFVENLIQLEDEEKDKEGEKDRKGGKDDEKKKNEKKNDDDKDKNKKDGDKKEKNKEEKRESDKRKDEKKDDKEEDKKDKKKDKDKDKDDKKKDGKKKDSDKEENDEEKEKDEKEESEEKDKNKKGEKGKEKNEKKEKEKDKEKKKDEEKGGKKGEENKDKEGDGKKGKDEKKEKNKKEEKDKTEDGSEIEDKDDGEENEVDDEEEKDSK